MSEVSPTAHHALICIFSELFFYGEPLDLEEDGVRLKRIFRSCNSQDRATITRVMRRFVTDPDADLSEFATPHQMNDGGAELRRRLAVVAGPIFDVHVHVREQDVNALRAWLDLGRPISELREYVLVELVELTPEQRGDVARVAFKDYRGITQSRAHGIGEGVRSLAARDVSAEHFDRQMPFYFPERDPGPRPVDDDDSDDG